VLVIEDARELQLQGAHVVQLETRPPDARGRHAVTIRDLFRASLRMRPDRIVLYFNFKKINSVHAETKLYKIPKT
jgi:pilus assembly protein CpaF